MENSRSLLGSSLDQALFCNPLRGFGALWRSTPASLPPPRKARVEEDNSTKTKAVAYERRISTSDDVLNTRSEDIIAKLRNEIPEVVRGVLDDVVAVEWKIPKEEKGLNPRCNIEDLDCGDIVVWNNRTVPQDCAPRRYCGDGPFVVVFAPSIVTCQARGSSSIDTTHKIFVVGPDGRGIAALPSCFRLKRRRGAKVDNQQKYVRYLPE